MDRREFLKTMGLLAITAPAGIAALKQMEFEPELDAATLADVAEKAREAAVKMEEVALCALDCADAMPDARLVTAISGPQNIFLQDVTVDELIGWNTGRGMCVDGRITLSGDVDEMPWLGDTVSFSTEQGTSWTGIVDSIDIGTGAPCLGLTDCQSVAYMGL